MTATRFGHGRAAHTPDDSEPTVEADCIAEVLAPHTCGHIVSSPFVRCVETMRPLASRLGVAVGIRAELAEGGASPNEAMQLLADLPERSVACLHGDMLEGLAGRLDVRGSPIAGSRSLEKGVVWALAFRNGDCVGAEVLHAPCRDDRISHGPLAPFDATCGQDPEWDATQTIIRGG